MNFSISTASGTQVLPCLKDEFVRNCRLQFSRAARSTTTCCSKGHCCGLALAETRLCAEEALGKLKHARITCCAENWLPFHPLSLCRASRRHSVPKLRIIRCLRTLCAGKAYGRPSPSLHLARPLPKDFGVLRNLVISILVLRKLRISWWRGCMYLQDLRI